MAAKTTNKKAAKAEEKIESKSVYLRGIITELVRWIPRRL